MATLDIDDLHGFGYSARQKAQDKLGATILGELAKKSKAALCDALGKSMGETLYNTIRGIDGKPLESDKPRKSVSCDINVRLLLHIKICFAKTFDLQYGIRFEDNNQAEAFVYQLAEEVSRRLVSIDMRGRSLTLKIMVRDPSAPVEAPKVRSNWHERVSDVLFSSKFMGHGLCQTYSKQTQLFGPGGRPTSDSKDIGDHAWRLLKTFNFDPKELRGIGIQIQKLEKSSGADSTETGQAVLPFKPVTDSAKTTAQTVGPQPASSSQDVQILVKPPTQSDDDSDIEIIENPNKPSVSSKHHTVDLPSFSQVDMSVFEALPDDVRKELSNEYERRSRSRSITPGLPGHRRSTTPTTAKPKATKGAHMTNVKRITQQLAPRSRSSISPAKTKLFVKSIAGSSTGAEPSGVSVSEAELEKLKIDAEVFAMLPVDLQHEQLAHARQKHKNAWLTIFPPQRKAKKPPSKGGKGKRRQSSSPGVIIPPPPLPKAKYIEPPMLKQQGKKKDEKLYFFETDDVQQVIEGWVTGFKEHPPNQKDVDYFAKYLVHCVDGERSSDMGLERAIAVAKWWLVLLRRYFGMWEHSPPFEDGGDGGQITSEVVGRAWWKAFREVKGKMDVVARTKFGGQLSLK